MNRIDELVHDITLYLKEKKLDELYIIRNDDRGTWLDNLFNITNHVSNIVIERIEDKSDLWGQVVGYKRVDGSTKGYNIILSNDAEKMNIQSIEDLAKAIASYEKEFNNILLLNNKNDLDKVLRYVLESELEYWEENCECDVEGDIDEWEKCKCNHIFLSAKRLFHNTK